jgi:hypothetical protein
MSTGLARCFDTFRVSAFRLETLNRYVVPPEDDRIAAFRTGQPLPERSVRTSPWLRRLARTTAAGKHWSRVHVVDRPPSDYVRFELVTYQESAEAGEVIGIADRRAHPALDYLRRDFWLFDAETDHPSAALISYDHDGGYIGAAVTTEPAIVAACRATRDLARRHSVPLHVYLARLTAGAS